MKSNLFSFRIIVFLGIVGALAPLSISQEAQKKPEAARGSNEQKSGTGVVPTGVKLAAQMPAAAPSKSFRFPQATTKTLSNGLRVFVIPDAEEPMVTARLVLTGAGSVSDPASKPGVAGMTADMLTQGTATRSAQQIAEAIDFVGGSLTANADKDGTHLVVRVVKKDFPLAMDLLSDILLHPAFNKEELERRRQQALSGLQVEYSDPSYIASAVLNRLVYGPHPYGLPGTGTPDSLRRIERDDLVQFRDSHYTPELALLAFAGEITAETAFAAADKYLGEPVWPKRGAAAGTPASPTAIQGLRIVMVDRSDANQTQIRIGRLGIPRNASDYIPLYVTNRIFGGGFNSRLSTEVRQKKGLTYGAYSNFNSFKLAGDFSASTFTRTEATAEATKLIVDLIARMTTGALESKELDFARDYLAGVFPIESETGEQVASRILGAAHYGLPSDYNDTYQRRVLAVSSAEVKQMAGRYFDPANLVIVLVGNVKEFRQAVQKEFPEAKYEEIPFDQVDLLLPDLRKPKPAAVAAAPESVERGKSLISAAAQAAGGDALERIESIEYASKGEYITPQGKFAVESKTIINYPDHLRIEMKMPMGVFTAGFDGKTGWIQSPQGSMNLPPSIGAENLRSIALAGGWGLLRQAMEGKCEVAYLGDEEVEGRKLTAAEWTSSAGPVKLYFDPSSRMLIGARYQQTGPQGLAEALELWSDFRSAEGAQFPYRLVQYRDGAKSADLAVSGVRLNTKTNEDFFSKPQQ